jgi:hypothetical protein
MAELFTTEQIDYLDKHFDDRYNDEFVHVKDCNDKQEEVNKKFANDNTEIRLLRQEQNQNNKLTWGILVGVVCLVIESFISQFL